MRRAQQQVLSFLALNSVGVPQTGLTFADGEVSLSKNCASFVALLGSRVTEIGLGYYYVTLTPTEANAGWLIVAVRKTGITATNDVFGATDSHPAFTVVADAGNTATTFLTDLPAAAANFYAGAGVRFNSGALQGQVREIASSSGATLTLAEPLTGVPAAGVTGEVVDS
jgi:hypothetical protein